MITATVSLAPLCRQSHDVSKPNIDDFLCRRMRPISRIQMEVPTPEITPDPIQAHPTCLVPQTKLRAFGLVRHLQAALANSMSNRLPIETVQNAERLLATMLISLLFTSCCKPRCAI